MVMRRCISSGYPSCLGYVISLLGANDYGQCGLGWKLGNFFRTQRIVRYCACAVADGTGDIFNWANVDAFKKVVAEDFNAMTNDSNLTKLHLILAESSFDAQRDADDQGGLTQKLITCEVATALDVLRMGGTFVLKLFGFQTEVARCVLRHIFN